MKGTRVYSFDVFDTIITRKTYEPMGIFSVMHGIILNDTNYNLLPLHLKNNFVQIRISSEFEARRIASNSGREEINFSDIYDVLMSTTCISNNEKDELMELEMEVEYQCCTPIIENIDKLKECLNLGEVYLISDMYLSESVIRNMLLKVDPVFSNIPILVSCDVGKTKNSGGLYEFFIQKYNIDVTKWIHMGDNQVSDCEAVADKHGNYIFYETNKSDILFNGMGDKYRYTSAYQLINGAIRFGDSQKSDSWHVGNQVGGPILYAYVYWVIKDSIERGINTVYFIVRDGYILKKVADCIVNCQNLKIKIKYLYGSRKAWQIPALCTDPLLMERWLFEKCDFNNIYELSNMLNMSVDLLKKNLPRYEYYHLDNLSRKDKLNIKYALLFSEIWDCVLRQGMDSRMKTIDYLRQEISVDDKKIGLVDLNGSGYTQYCLNRLLGEFYSGDVFNYYYMSAGLDVEAAHNIKTLRFCYKKFNNNDVIEILCRAPYGQTVGYEEKDGEWKPVIDDIIKEYPEGQDYEDYCDGVLAFSKIMSSNCLVHPEDLEDYTFGLLNNVCEEPNKIVGDFIGDMPFSVTGLSGNTYARKLKGRELRKLYLYGHPLPINGYEGNLNYSIIRAKIEHENKILVYQKLNKIIFGKFPYKNNTRNKKESVVKGRVIIYGAGKRGRALYGMYEKNRVSKIILWVDRQFEKYREEGLNVEPPQSIIDAEYDYVIISVADVRMNVGIRKELIEMGVPWEKLI